MMQLTTKNILQRYYKAKERKNSILPVLEECYRYFLPQYEANAGYNHSHHNRIYDSTGVLSLQSFAANLKYQLLPPWRKWCKIVLSAQTIEKMQKDSGEMDPVEIEQQIEQKVTEPFFDALNHSNFDAEISQSMLELGIGTGALLINEGTDEDPLVFSAVPIKDITIEESPFGKVENVYREREIEQEHLLRLWPKAQIPHFLEQKNTEKIRVLEATVYCTQSKKFVYKVIQLDTQWEFFHTNFDVSPWVVFRWSKIAGEVYGRGPVMQCLCDAKEANKIKELSVKNALLNLVPTYMVASDGLINPQLLEIKPGSLIPVRSLSTGSPIQPLARGADFNFGQLNLENARSVIRHTLFVDRLGQVDGPVRSATEIHLRSQETAKEIGAAFGRLQTEMIEKIVRRCLYILKKKGVVLPIDVNGRSATLKITSPLNQAQEQEDLLALSQILPYYSTFPDEFRLSIKTESLPAFVAKKAAIPPELLRTEDEKNALASTFLQFNQAPSQASGQAPQQQDMP